MIEGYNYNLSSNIFLQELMNMANSIVWKNPLRAIEEEPSDIYIEVDMYKAAYDGILTFESIYQFEYDVLIRCGIDPELAERCVDDKYNIPLSKRDLCTSQQIKSLIENYEEQNNYYRMLYGLPDMDDTDFLYAPEESGLDTTIPVHLLPLSDRFTLEENGYTDKLLEKYPKKKYLKYIGKKRIEPYIARTAPRFAMLYFEASSYSNLTADFKDTYYQCRDYVDRVFYDKAFRRNNEYFEEFIAMSILFMTLQLMLHKYLDADITREFYDVESIRLLYESYGVPYYKEIPLEYHLKIVKNINRLLSNKGNTVVFLDIFDIFNYANMDLYQYYLVKRRKFDEDGNPVFVYKEDGTLDEEACYEIAFVKVLVDGDIDLEITDSNNKVVYEALTSDDPYWVNDPELIKDLYQEEYNYIETKYMGVELMFDMYRILFESCYFMRMIQDKKFSTITIPYYYANVQRNVSVFSLVIYACCLVCKRSGYTGNIPSNPAGIARVLGFNFKDNLTKIIEDVRSNKYLKDDTALTSFIMDMNINDINDINKVFSNISDFHDYINNRLFEVKDKDVFQAYYELKKLLLTTEHINEIYQKSDGTMAASFDELLMDSDPYLYQRLRELSDDSSLSTEISYVLAALSSLSDKLKMLEFSDSANLEAVIRYLMKMIDFFKSAKVDLKDFAVVYTIKSPTFNMLKLIGDIYMIYDEWGGRDTISFKEWLLEYETCYPYDLLLAMCGIKSIYEEWGQYDKFRYLTDEIYSHIIYNNDAWEEKIKMIDFYISENETTWLKDKFSGNLQDQLIKVYDEIWYPTYIHYVKDAIKYLRDSLLQTYTLYYNENLNLIDIFIRSEITEVLKDSLSLEDGLKKVYDRLYIEHEEFKSSDKFRYLTDRIIPIIHDRLNDHTDIRDALDMVYEIQDTRAHKLALSDKLIKLYENIVTDDDTN